MKKLAATLSSRIPAGLVVCLFAMAWPEPLPGDGRSENIIGRPDPAATVEARMTTGLARGTFDVTLTPQPATDGLGRMRIDKRFQGDLEATSEGEMLTWRDESIAAAAYVAIERVTGSLDDRAGSFVLTHQGTMTDDDQRLTVTVVPGSGTGQLIGIEGAMAIDVSEGRHRYEFEYRLGSDPEP